jgi:hypothetical protein
MNGNEMEKTLVAIVVAVLAVWKVALTLGVTLVRCARATQGLAAGG